MLMWPGVFRLLGAQVMGDLDVYYRFGIWIIIRRFISQRPGQATGQVEGIFRSNDSPLRYTVSPRVAFQSCPTSRGDRMLVGSYFG